MQLKQTVNEMKQGLDSEIQKSGSNLSVGQKQLVCLARAILKNSKLIIIDEATANVDLTYVWIECFIKKKFLILSFLFYLIHKNWFACAKGDPWVLCQEHSSHNSASHQHYHRQWQNNGKLTNTY